MAEIPIQRKDKRSMWPMLLGLLALVVVLALVFGRKHSDRAAVANGSSTTSTTSGGAVANPSGDTTHH